MKPGSDRKISKRPILAGPRGFIPGEGAMSSDESPRIGGVETPDSFRARARCRAGCERSLQRCDVRSNGYFVDQSSLTPLRHHRWRSLLRRKPSPQTKENRRWGKLGHSVTPAHSYDEPPGPAGLPFISSSDNRKRALERGGNRLPCHRWAGLYSAPEESVKKILSDFFRTLDVR